MNLTETAYILKGYHQAFFQESGKADPKIVKHNKRLSF